MHVTPQSYSIIHLLVLQYVFMVPHKKVALVNSAFTFLGFKWFLIHELEIWHQNKIYTYIYGIPY